MLRLFDERSLPLTIFGVAMALARNPAVVDASMKAGHEIASHGFRWISYQNVAEDVERQHIAQAVETIARADRRAAAGWYTGRDSPHTRALVVEHGGFVYDADTTPTTCRTGARRDERRRTRAPPRRPVHARHQRHALRDAQGFNSGDQFFTYLRDAFDTLYAEGDPRGGDAPKMLSIGLHGRIVGRPGRIAALARFLDHVQRHERRLDRAAHRHRAALDGPASLRSAHADRKMSSRHS